MKPELEAQPQPQPTRLGQPPYQDETGTERFGPPTSCERARLPAIFLNPTVGFAVIWILALSLAQVHVLSVQTPWSGTAWLVMVIVPVAFLAGGLLTYAVVRRAVAARAAAVRIVQSPRRLLVILLVIGYAELAREFASIGMVPLFSSHVDATRTAISSGALELLQGGLTICVIVSLSTPPSLRARAAIPDLMIAGVAVFGFLLGGGRETAVIPIVAGMLARSLRGPRPTLRTLAACALLGMGAFSLIFYLRTGQEVGQAFADELYGSVVPGTAPPFVPFLPIHFALALNDTVLARLIATFPASVPFGHGIYETGALHSILPYRSLGNITKHLAPPWFVATLAGPMWADGGLPVVVVGCVVTGGVSALPYWLYRRTARHRYLWLAGYLGTLGLFSVYDSFFTEYKDWVFVGAGLLLLGRYVESRGAQQAPRATPPSASHPSVRTQPTERSPAWSRFLLPAGAIATIAALFALVVIVAERNVHREQLLAKPVSVSAFSQLKMPRDIPGFAALQVLDTRLVPRGVLDGVLATDGDANGSSTVWSFSRKSGHLFVRLLKLQDKRLVPGPLAEDLGPAPPATRAQYGIGHWGSSRQYAVFEMVRRDTRLTITVVRPGSPARVLAKMQTPQNSWPPHTSPVIALATRSGNVPDLFIVDTRSDLTSVVILSGTSRFHDVVLAAQVAGFPPRDWNAVVGSINSRSADVMFASRSAKTSTRRIEVHVLPAPYTQFAEQAPLALAAKDVEPIRFLLTHVRGQPALYGIDPARAQIMLLALAPLRVHP